MPGGPISFELKRDTYELESHSNHSVRQRRLLAYSRGSQSSPVVHLVTISFCHLSHYRLRLIALSTCSSEFFIYQYSIKFSGNDPGTALSQFFTGLMKLLLASLIAGALMNLFGLSAEKILASIGLTPLEAWEHIARFIAWAIPNVMLGAVVILPVWFFAFLFLPPRSYDE